MTNYISLEERNRIADEFHRGQGPLLPATIDDAVDGKISYAYLEKGLTIRFPFVEGMRVGGPYHLTMGSADAGFGIGGQIQEENQDTLVAVSADQALAFQGQEASLRYYYFEFEEPTSPLTQYSIEEGPGERIFKPQVDEAVDGVIPLAVLSQGVNLRIKAGLSLTPDALVSIYWWGTHADGCFVKHLTVGPDPDEDLVVRVEPAHLMPHKGGRVRVICTALSTTGTQTSLLLELKVASGLAVPEAVYPVDEDLRIPAQVQPIIEEGGIPLLLKTQGMAAGDVAILMSYTVHPYTGFVRRYYVKASDIEAGQIRFSVPTWFPEDDLYIWVWGLIHRRDGGVVGSPDFFLVVPGMNSASANPF